MKYICIHGHFYQPPRENPWLNEVEMQESAYPYHNWNERVTAECYARNAASRILDEKENIIDIINIYSKISFNFGPTLLSWMKTNDLEVYRAILRADKMSCDKFEGHGSAIAQVYNHMIMPLANSRDKRTQVVWGLRDFEHRFLRKPEGMWLAETAVDLETLELLAEYGVKFTILAPSQAQKVRAIGEEEWRDVSGQKIDPRRPYLCPLPSGKSIAIFFYDGPASRAVAFEGLLNNGEHFAQRLLELFDKNPQQSQLAHIATDGETYGHHHKFGEMALSYCLRYIEEKGLAQITNYGMYLADFPPKDEVQIFENTSWSCAHGVGRWHEDCGCNTGMNRGWNQKWRQPLREALDWLRDKVIPLYEETARQFVEDPWALRDEYVEVVLDRKTSDVEYFIEQNVKRELPADEKVRLLKLLEIQHNAMLMYTSCGWFFDEVSGIETVQIIKYAARVIQLAQEIFQQPLEEEFVERLRMAKSNIPDFQDGVWIYQNFVKPSIVDLNRVGAHFAVSSLFEDYSRGATIYSYRIDSRRYEFLEAGRMRSAVGEALVRSQITWESKPFTFAVFHMGDHNLMCGVADEMDEKKFEQLFQTLKKVFERTNIPEVIAVLHKYFGDDLYSLWHLFRDEQQKVLMEVLKSTTEEIESAFRQIHEHHYSLLNLRKEIQVPLPKSLSSIVEFILEHDLQELLEAKGDTLDTERLKNLVQEIMAWPFERDRATLNFTASQKINYQMTALSKQINNINLMENIDQVITTLRKLRLDLDLWKAQNIFFSLSKKVYPHKKEEEKADPQNAKWLEAFRRLGQSLRVRIV